MRRFQSVERVCRLTDHLLQPMKASLDVRQLDGHSFVAAVIPAEQPRAVENGANKRDTAANDDEREKHPEFMTHERTRQMKEKNIEATA